MSGFSLDVSGGSIDKGDTKRVRFEPTDNDGNSVTPSTISLTATKPDRSTVTKSKSDFVENDGVWDANITFDQEGVWKLNLDVSDGTNSEVSIGAVKVQT